MAEDDREFRDALAFQGFADEGCMGDGYVRVINYSLGAIDNGEARDAKGKGAIVHPIVFRSEAITFNAAIVECIDVVMGMENAKMGNHVAKYAIKKLAGKRARMLRY